MPRPQHRRIKTSIISRRTSFCPKPRAGRDRIEMRSDYFTTLAIRGSPEFVFVAKEAKES